MPAAAIVSYPIAQVTSPVCRFDWPGAGRCRRVIGAGACTESGPRAVLKSTKTHRAAKSGKPNKKPALV
jgi:hypothetical protein